MVDWKKVDAAVEFFCHNEFWEGVYKNAPSDECRKHYAMSFYFSTFWDDAHEDEDFFRMRDEVDSRLNIEDWKYVLKYQGNNPGRVKIKQRIKKLEEKENV